jgi:hypothetical protein
MNYRDRQVLAAMIEANPDVDPRELERMLLDQDRAIAEREAREREAEREQERARIEAKPAQRRDEQEAQRQYDEAMRRRYPRWPHYITKSAEKPPPAGPCFPSRSRRRRGKRAAPSRKIDRT